MKTSSVVTKKIGRFCGRVGGSEIVSFDELHSLRWGELVGVEGAVGRNLSFIYFFRLMKSSL